MKMLGSYCTRRSICFNSIWVCRRLLILLSKWINILRIWCSSCWIARNISQILLSTLRCGWATLHLIVSYCRTVRLLSSKWIYLRRNISCCWIRWLKCKTFIPLRNRRRNLIRWEWALFLHAQSCILSKPPNIVRRCSRYSKCLASRLQGRTW